MKNEGRKKKVDYLLAGGWPTGHCYNLYHFCSTGRGWGGGMKGAVWESRWQSWAPVPNKPTVSVDVKQHFIIVSCLQELWVSQQAVDLWRKWFTAYDIKATFEQFTFGDKFWKSGKGGGGYFYEFPNKSMGFICKYFTFDKAVTWKLLNVSVVLYMYAQTHFSMRFFTCMLKHILAVINLDFYVSHKFCARSSGNCLLTFAENPLKKNKKNCKVITSVDIVCRCIQ